MKIPQILVDKQKGERGWDSAERSGVLKHFGFALSSLELQKTHTP